MLVPHKDSDTTTDDWPAPGKKRRRGVDLRDPDFVRHFGVYGPGETLHLEMRPCSPSARTVRIGLKRVVFSERWGRVALEDCRDYGSVRFGRLNRETVRLPSDAARGVYLVSVSADDGAVAAVKIFVHPREARPSVGIVNPVFTEWAYHDLGFYPTHDGKTLTRASEAARRLMRRLPGLRHMSRTVVAGVGVHLESAAPRFPARSSVRLS